MEGTSSYGNAHGDPLGPDFSKKFDESEFDYFLFSTGDMSKWMIMKKDEVIGSYYLGCHNFIKKYSTGPAG